MNRENAAPDTLYNGIKLPEIWPPTGIDGTSREPLPVPYLQNPPAVIPIQVGRQLFVDDFLIEQSTLHRTFHKPRWHEGNPVLKPETGLEMNSGVCPVACPFNDGVFYDPKDQLFKMWYHAGWFDGIAYAESKDGIRWERKLLDIEPGTNRVLATRPGFRRDGVGVWLDHDAQDPNERFKMFAYFRTPDGEFGEVYTSPDGIHWGEPVRTGPCGDNTTFFYNPFRQKWVYSIRTGLGSDRSYFRIRSYREHDDFVQGADWSDEDTVVWSRADDLDPPHPEHQCPTQLYNIDAVAYESVILGLFQIHQGPPNHVCEEAGFPKITELMIGFSRDGFHFDRSDRTPFLACSQQEGTWNRAYLHSAGGSCLVVGDELYFYVGGFSGISPQRGGDLYAGASTGLAVLRRDGFASMDAPQGGGELMTRLIRFDGSYLFVNANTKDGELRVELLDESGHAVDGYTMEDCIPVRADQTLAQVQWVGRNDLSDWVGKPVKLRFLLTEGELYSFWVSPDAFGASRGFVAAGGPGFTGPIDTVGSK
ncbi:glycosyl hydrolase family 32 [Paenibacillus piri]|uniref:Glycosyl hydrolase family 32 n=1 Tax=Paenibacillus piri TaxID=2547395 RepID=A0A4R5KUQ5_9BACL|nr:glycosyl hydrolase family 32 [Paenibacillus piri]TDF98805.1 glycosyl hydrolase family 32 [Paenibacillus piri]